VRQLFANLHEAQVEAQRVRSDKMRTVVIGHSFGGLVAYSALSQGLLNDLTLAGWDHERPCASGAQDAAARAAPAVWPDTLILINPAFEASRFEEMHRFIGRRTPCTPAAPPASRLVVPSLIVVTAENDRWTGRVFTAGRAVSTLLESYDRTDAAATADERTSNLHAIGFVKRYQTHRLDLAASAGAPGADAKAVATLSATDDPSGNVDTPVWVVSASPAIIDGHDGFLYSRPRDKNPQPYLANWLLDLYNKDCAAAPGMKNCKPAGP
jgi:hypothetical protein